MNGGKKISELEDKSLGIYLSDKKEREVRETENSVQDLWDAMTPMYCAKTDWIRNHIQ